MIPGVRKIKTFKTFKLVTTCLSDILQFPVSFLLKYRATSTVAHKVVRPKRGEGAWPNTALHPRQYNSSLPSKVHSLCDIIISSIPASK